MNSIILFMECEDMNKKIMLISDETEFKSKVQLCQLKKMNDDMYDYVCDKYYMGICNGECTNIHPKKNDIITCRFISNFNNIIKLNGILVLSDNNKWYLKLSQKEYKNKLFELHFNKIKYTKKRGFCYVEITYNNICPIKKKLNSLFHYKIIIF
jgi:hypothetical protein